jgi:hypothetical protein
MIFERRDRQSYEEKENKRIDKKTIYKREITWGKMVKTKEEKSSSNVHFYIRQFYATLIAPPHVVL